MFTAHHDRAPTLSSEKYSNNEHVCSMARRMRMQPLAGECQAPKSFILTVEASKIEVEPPPLAFEKWLPLPGRPPPELVDAIIM